MNNNISVGLTNYCCNFVCNKIKKFRKDIRNCNSLYDLNFLHSEIVFFSCNMSISFDFFNLPINKGILLNELKKLLQSINYKREKIKENN